MQSRTFPFAGHLPIARNGLRKCPHVVAAIFEIYRSYTKTEWHTCLVGVGHWLQFCETRTPDSIAQCDWDMCVHADYANASITDGFDFRWEYPNRCHCQWQCPVSGTSLIRVYNIISGQTLPFGTTATMKEKRNQWAIERHVRCLCRSRDKFKSLQHIYCSSLLPYAIDSAIIGFGKRYSNRRSLSFFSTRFHCPFSVERRANDPFALLFWSFANFSAKNTSLGRRLSAGQWGNRPWWMVNLSSAECWPMLGHNFILIQLPVSLQPINKLNGKICFRRKLFGCRNKTMRN